MLCTLHHKYVQDVLPIFSTPPTTSLETIRPYELRKFMSVGITSSSTQHNPFDV
jgi:hypothetical protein